MKQNPYENILNHRYPFTEGPMTKRPRMSREDRAKIFAPFAALKGYEQAIEAKQKIIVPKVELTEEEKDQVNSTLNELVEQLNGNRHPIVTVTYFKPEPDMKDQPPKGQYLEITGMLAKIRPDKRVLQIVDYEINFDEIRQLNM